MSSSIIKLCLSMFAKILWAAYLVVTSIYCLLAFVPYTYLALIKAPPYEWIPWFVRQHAVLFWLQLLLSVLIFFRKENRTALTVICVAEIVGATYLARSSFLQTIQSDSAAFFSSLCFLLPIILFSVVDLSVVLLEKEEVNEPNSLLSWRGFAFVGVAIALSSAAGGLLLIARGTGVWQITTRELEFLAWSLISHLTVAFLLFALVNLAYFASVKTRWPRLVRTVLLGTAGWLSLWFFLVRFLHTALDLHGWQAQAHASLLGLSLVTVAANIAAPFRSARRTNEAASLMKWKIAGLFAFVALIAIAVFLPSALEGGDWNGVLMGTFMLALWCVLIFAILYALPLRANYSVPGLVAVVVITVSLYYGLYASKVVWSRGLGSTDEEIAASLDSYAEQDGSFALTRRALGGTGEKECDDLCRIMRQYTNVRYGLNPDVQLVDKLTATSNKRPNIFIFVIDSLRPDYLGAYNPRLDFTPNLDAFARDSVVLHRVFTQYSGTSLSEPAIWAGVELLHTHQLQPFAKINGLEKLAHADHYQMIVSYDDIIKELLVPSDDLVKLDTDRTVWNSLEVCSTIQELESQLNGASGQKPVLFFTQPKNVHQFARNKVPPPSPATWQSREGLNNRIAYATHYVDTCIGGFFSYLKTRGLYDSSIIIFTSDHGDATGEFGRKGHGNTVYPEVIHVPLIVHLPKSVRNQILFDDQSRVSTLTDITPSLYYLLGHRQVVTNPLFGRPIFVDSQADLQKYDRTELFVAADITSVFGVLDQNARFLYFRNDSSPQAFLFDLAVDPNALHNILTDDLRRRYDDRVLEHWDSIAAFYGFKGDKQREVTTAASSQ